MTSTLKKEWILVSTNSLVGLVMAKDGSLRHPNNFGPSKISPRIWKTKQGANRYAQRQQLDQFVVPVLITE